MKSGKIDFPELTAEERRARLQFPKNKVMALLDTDTFNEVDDQFALSYAMLSPEFLDMRAVTAAPFLNHRSESPADGMQKSYDEIIRILDLLKKDSADFVFKGSEQYLPDRNTPVDSPAASRIIELAYEAGQKGELLYVIAIGAITNVASALLMDPAILNHIVVVWLGGHPTYWGDNKEFNLIQDVPAAQVIFDSGVPLVQIPCMSVAELLAISIPELDVYCRNLGGIGEFLYLRVKDFMSKSPNHTKVIWDISAIAFFSINKSIEGTVIKAPRISDNDGAYGASDGRHEMFMVNHVWRNYIFPDLFNRLAAFQKK